MISYAKKTTVFSVLIAVILLGLALFVSRVNAQTAPANTAAGSSIEQRVNQRKQERQVKLDETNSKRLESVCVNTQTKVRILRDEYVKVADKRSEIYRKVDARLWVLIGSLKYINKDTFKLEQQRSELLKQVNAYENSVTQFRQTLEDTAAVNCKADPAGFKALIETARLYNSQIRTQANSIRQYVTDQIKPTVTAHANDLKPKTSTE